MRIVNKIEAKTPQIPRRKRVAAYARVSMESERLQHSLSAQVSYNYTGFGQGDASDTAFNKQGNDACHLGFSLTNDLGRLTKAYVGKKNPKLAREGLNIVTIQWDAVQSKATLSFEDTAGAGVSETLSIGSDKFDPEALWGDKPVYMTISAAIHQNNTDSDWGSYYLKVDNFVYTDLDPEESAKYLIYRGGDMTSTPVTYKSDDMMTWPMPGDKVVAEHTMSNSTNDVDKPISIPIRVPEARISDSSNRYNVVQELTPTDLNGTTGETNIFNGAKSGSALSTAPLPSRRLTNRNEMRRPGIPIPSPKRSKRSMSLKTR